MLVGIVFVSIYAARLHWSIMPIYLGVMLILALLTSLLSKKIKVKIKMRSLEKIKSSLPNKQINK
jgi:hypothetical protein